MKDGTYIDLLLRHSGDTLRAIQSFFPFTIEELKRYRTQLDWDILSLNPNIPWSLDLFKEFDFELTIHPEDLSEDDLEEIESIGCNPGGYQANLSLNKNIKWTVDMLDYAKDKVSWLQIGSNWPLEKNAEMLERFEDYIDWDFPCWQWEPEWTAELIKKFAQKLDIRRMFRTFFRLSLGDDALRDMLMKFDSSEYISQMIRYEKCQSQGEEYLKKIRYEHTLKNGQIDPSPEDILYALENFSTDTLPFVVILEWSPGLIEYLSDRPDWWELCNYSELPFTEEIIDKHQDKVEFGRISEEGYVYSGISLNEKLPWSESFIRKYQDRWYWKHLSLNPSLPWSEELLDTFSEQWDWACLPHCQSGFWNIKRISKYKDKLCWYNMSDSCDINYSPALLEAFEDKWEKSVLFQNETFIEKAIQPAADIQLIELLLEKLK